MCVELGAEFGSLPLMSSLESLSESTEKGKTADWRETNAFNARFQSAVERLTDFSAQVDT